MSVSINTEFSELTTLGIKFYKEHLKNLIEPTHNGEFVAIEPYSGKYFIDKIKLKAIQKARTEMPDNSFFSGKSRDNLHRFFKSLCSKKPVASTKNYNRF